VLRLAPSKRVELSAHGPPLESCSLPSYAELSAEQAQSGLVVATEVVEPVAPPPSSGTNNSGKEQVTEVTASQAVMEPQAEVVLGAAMS
jgi:hypothetical protein